MKIGNQISIISNSFMAIESLKASKLLSKYGVSSEVLDLRVIRPLGQKINIKNGKKK